MQGKDTYLLHQISALDNIINFVIDRITQKHKRLGLQMCTTLSAQGVHPNNRKVQAIQEFPRPTSTKAVKSFLGIVNLYRRHVKNMAAIAQPLTALTRKDKNTAEDNCSLHLDTH